MAVYGGSICLSAFPAFWERVGTYKEKINIIGKAVRQIKEVDKRLMRIETEHNMFTKGKIRH